MFAPLIRGQEREEPGLKSTGQSRQFSSVSSNNGNPDTDKTGYPGAEKGDEQPESSCYLCISLGTEVLLGLPPTSKECSGMQLGTEEVH